MAEPRIVIVGAGPAGIRAAETLADNGLRPILLDEAPRDGGQIYRRPPIDGIFGRSAAQLYGFEAGKAMAIHDAADRLRDRVDYRPNTLVWDIVDRAVHTSGNGRVEALPFDRLVLATGAMDRIVPFPGWTRPGVFSLGGAQIALKYQGCAIGRRPLFLGTGPLLYLVAWQYARAGVRPAALLDTSRFGLRIKALPQLLARSRFLAKGAYYHGWLRQHGVPLETAIAPIEVTGADKVEGLLYRRLASDTATREISCDSIAFGFDLKSETQLAELAGCRFRWDDGTRQWLPETDAAGRALGIDGIYLAGDGAGIGGADMAELRGRRAAWALIEDLGRPADRRFIATLDSNLRRWARFRKGLQAAFPFPSELARSVADGTIVCRCEAVTAGELRQSARDLDATELNRAKAYSRLGMGRCQGRICGPAAAEILAAALGIPVERTGRLRCQAPVKPLAVGTLAGP